MAAKKMDRNGSTPDAPASGPAPDPPGGAQPNAGDSERVGVRNPRGAGAGCRRFLAVSASGCSSIPLPDPAAPDAVDTADAPDAADPAADPAADVEDILPASEA